MTEDVKEAERMLCFLNSDFDRAEVGGFQWLAQTPVVLSGAARSSEGAER